MTTNLQIKTALQQATLIQPPQASPVPPTQLESELQRYLNALGQKLGEKLAPQVVTAAMQSIIQSVKSANPEQLYQQLCSLLPPDQAKAWADALQQQSGLTAPPASSLSQPGGYPTTDLVDSSLVDTAEFFASLGVSDLSVALRWARHTLGQVVDPPIRSEEVAAIQQLMSAKQIQEQLEANPSQPYAPTDLPTWVKVLSGSSPLIKGVAGALLLAAFFMAVQVGRLLSRSQPIQSTAPQPVEIIAPTPVPTVSPTPPTQPTPISSPAPPALGARTALTFEAWVRCELNNNCPAP